MSKKINVLHVFGSTDYGGAEKRTVELMSCLDPSLFQFDVCALSKQKGPLDSHIQKLGCKVFYLAKRNPNFGRHFLNILKTRNYDIVHVHVYPFAGYILYLSHKVGIKKRIVHFRSSYERQQNIFRKGFRIAMNYLIYKHATDILAVCQGAMNIVWGQYQDHRCEVIYNGIDLSIANKTSGPDVRQQYQIPQNNNVILHVGSMRPVKNHEMVIKTFYEIQLVQPNSSLLLVGKRNIDIEQKILLLCEKFNITKKVFIVGANENVYSFLKAANLFLFPSFFEGLPGAVLEACAVNLPVLASDIPGVNEIATYCPNVHSLPLTDSPKQWAQKSLEIMDKQFNIKLDTTPFCLQNNKAALLRLYM